MSGIPCALRKKNPFFEVMLDRTDGETLMIKRPLEKIRAGQKARSETRRQHEMGDWRLETGYPANRNRRKDWDIVVGRCTVDRNCETQRPLAPPDTK